MTTLALSITALGISTFLYGLCSRPKWTFVSRLFLSTGAVSAIWSGWEIIQSIPKSDQLPGLVALVVGDVALLALGLFLSIFIRDYWKPKKIEG